MCVLRSESAYRVENCPGRLSPFRRLWSAEVPRRKPLSSHNTAIHAGRAAPSPPHRCAAVAAGFPAATHPFCRRQSGASAPQGYRSLPSRKPTLHRKREPPQSVCRFPPLDLCARPYYNKDNFNKEVSFWRLFCKERTGSQKLRADFAPLYLCCVFNGTS